MITDAQGRPIVTENTEGRSIKITEVMHNGKPSWSVDFFPTITSFEFEEVIMILGETIRGIAQQARARVYEAKAMHQVKQKIEELKQGEK